MTASSTLRLDDRPDRPGAARRARARGARAGRAAVGDPALLRHPRDDGRRHQPRGGGARLRHAASGSSRPACGRSTTAGPTTRRNYGTIELREALAAHLERRYGVAYDPATELLITVGASEAVDLALRATCDPGDEVILHEPSYVAYVPGGRVRGRHVRHVATRLEDDFALDPAAVEAAITPRTKALFLGYPCNPTGAVLPDDVQDELAAIAERHDLLVYSDEIYDRLAYGVVPPPGVQRAARDARADDPHGRLLEGLRDDRLAGRLARGAGGDPRGDREGPPVRDHVGADVAQDAALEALVGGEADVERMRAEYDRRRRLVVDGLNGIGPARRSSRAARSTPSREVTTATGPDRRRRSPRGCSRRSASRSIPGSRLRASRRGPRPRVLRDLATSSSRRPSAGSGGSWTATGPAPLRRDDRAAAPGARRFRRPPPGPARPHAASPSTAALSTLPDHRHRGQHPALGGAAPTEMAAALALHDAPAPRPPSRARGGTVIKTTGDGLLAVFDEPVAALAAALDAQRALRDADWGEIGPLRVRMAIHSGTAEIARRRLLRPGAQPLGPDPRDRPRRPDPALGDGGGPGRRPPARRASSCATSARTACATSTGPSRSSRSRSPTCRATSRRSARSAPGGRTCPSS